MLAVNLPGRAGNPCPPDQVTLDSHRDCVLAAIERLPGPVVLAGHSFAGITLSALAEAASEKILRLVYVAAYLPRSGESARTLAEEDSASLLGAANFIISPDRHTASVPGDDCVRVFGEDLVSPWRERLPQWLVAEPLAPIRTAVTLSPGRFGKVTKIYVRTAQDRTITPTQQDRMISRANVRTVLTLDSAHLPFLSRPRELATVLSAAAAP